MQRRPTYPPQPDRWASVRDGAAQNATLRSLGPRATQAAAGSHAHVLSRVTTDVVVNNTVTETALVSVTVTGGLLQLSGRVRVTLEGTYLNNSGATRTLQLRGKFGATTLIDVTSGNIAANAALRAFKFVFELSNQSDPAVQLASLAGALGAVSNAAAGVGAFVADNATERWAVEATGTAAENSLADLTLAVTATHSAANANLTLTLQGALEELI